MTISYYRCSLWYLNVDIILHEFATQFTFTSPFALVGLQIIAFALSSRSTGITPSEIKIDEQKTA